MLNQDSSIPPANGCDDGQNERREEQENDGDAGEDVIVSTGDDSDH